MIVSRAIWFFWGNLFAALAAGGLLGRYVGLLARGGGDAASWVIAVLLLVTLTLSTTILVRIVLTASGPSRQE